MSSFGFCSQASGGQTLAMLHEVKSGLLPAWRGAELIGVSVWHFRRMRREWERKGDVALSHGGRTLLLGWLVPTLCTIYCFADSECYYGSVIIASALFTLRLPEVLLWRGGPVIRRLRGGIAGR